MEGNAVDSHIDLLQFIKGKNDLIIVNLALNPLMVEVDSIEKLNNDLIAKAPDQITQKTPEEVIELKELLGQRDSSFLNASAENEHEKSQRHSP